MITFELKQFNKISAFPILSPILILLLKLFYSSKYSEPWARVYQLIPYKYLLDICDKYRHFLAGAILIFLFIFSSFAIKTLLKAKTKKLFISLIKCSVGYYLTGLYIGYYLISAHSIDNIINNIIILITALFFFIDGLHDINDYITNPRPSYSVKYIKQRALKFELVYLFLFYTLSPISIMWLYSVEVTFIEVGYINQWILVPLLIFATICLICTSYFLSFGDKYISIIGDESLYNIDKSQYKVDKFKISFKFYITVYIFLLFVLCIFNSTFYIAIILSGITTAILLFFSSMKKLLFDFFLDKIFDDVHFYEFKQKQDSIVENYYNKCIKLNINLISLSDLKGKDCLWYNILNFQNKPLGHAFIFNKNSERETFIFIFINKCKRGHGFGNTALKKLEEMPEVKYKDIRIQLKDDVHDLDLIRNMLNKNGYEEIKN